MHRVHPSLPSVFYFSACTFGHITSDDTADDVKELIKTKKSTKFDDIAPNKLTLWQVFIQVADDDEELPTVLDTIRERRNCARQTTSQILFPARQLKSQFTSLCNDSSSTNFDDDVVFQVILKNKNSTTLTWYTHSKNGHPGESTDHHCRKATILGRRLRTLVVEDSTGVEIVADDGQLWYMIRRYVQGGIEDMVVRLEVLSKPFPDITTSDACGIYDTDEPSPLYDLATTPLASKEHTQALDELYGTLGAALKSMVSEDGAGIPTYINSFYCALLRFSPTSNYQETRVYQEGEDLGRYRMWWSRRVVRPACLL
ncbi:hypothetical protein BC939DRAFT_497186 [Gamsiella multidivaricata]|uniref:uncharacterized protein n=1 Tax=Gamsiella multidivaricata TaxID=101098 RepID=UPI00221E611F|nr:uncharacterized protein BC939DRAFT_497186 [Gamsiella multidivaricata]KAI7816756.1 hypothetical protein BC939DRAFT_497186 [Gamsiella multidivaricata]